MRKVSCAVKRLLQDSEGVFMVNNAPSPECPPSKGRSLRELVLRQIASNGGFPRALPRIAQKIFRLLRTYGLRRVLLAALQGESPRLELEVRIADLSRRLDASSRRNRELEDALHTVRDSCSWKLTAPLRGIAEIRRRLYARPQPLLSLKPLDVRALECNLPLLDEASLAAGKQPFIGVFLHVYYTDLASEMLACVRLLPETAFVHVSTDTQVKRDELTTLFAQEGFSERSEIRVVPNKGWDIAPFLVGFSDVIDRYDLVLRLHSKRSVQITGQTGDRWRQMLFESLAGNRRRVESIMRGFMLDPKLGMVCPPILPYYANCVHFGDNFLRMKALLEKRGITISPDARIDFPMGSMFWCRPAALRTWIEPPFTFDDFTKTPNDERDGSLAHALERLFFFGCGIAGLTWARVPALHQ